MSDDLNKSIESQLSDQFDFDSADAIEKLMEKVGADDEPLQTGEGDTKTEAPPAQPEKAEPAPPEAKESSEPPAAADAPKERIDGVIAKDGKHLLPYAALEAERRAKKEAEQRAADLEAKLRERDQAEAAKKRQADDAEFEAEMARIEPDMPDIAKRMRADRAARIALEERIEGMAKPAAASPAPAPEPDSDPVVAGVQSDINAIPSLAAWQREGGAAWQRAVDLDKALEASRAYPTRAARFAAVAKLVESEMGAPVSPSPSPSPKPAPTPPAAARAVQSLSDLQGTPPQSRPAETDWDAADVHAELGKAQSMSLDELMRQVGIPT